MRRRSVICRILTAAGSEDGIRAIQNALRGTFDRGEVILSRSTAIAQIRQRVSSCAGGEPIDILIVKLPLEDENGIEKVLDIAEKNNHLQILLLVRRDIYEQTVYRCRGCGIMVLSLPAQVQVIAQAVRYMWSVHANLARREEEVLQLQKKLSDIGYITKAKCILIQNRAMSEEEAHYYLEKEAMDRCLPKKDVALEIIRKAEAER